MGALEAMPNYNDVFNFNYMLYDSLGVAVGGSTENVFLLGNDQEGADVGSSLCLPVLQQGQFPCRVRGNQRVNVGVQGRKKRRRRPKVCKNKEEAETQRMTHIAVERNRRKLMNEHLAVLRTLMPESYSLRGDQASIVGGAIQFVKELEHLVHSLEAQKILNLQNAEINRLGTHDTNPTTTPLTPLIPNVFSDHHHSAVGQNSKLALRTTTEVAEVEVTLIETHANLRILSKKNPRQLSKLVSGFQSLCFTVLHVNVTTFDRLVLYSISIKVEEGCQLTSVDSISEAVHQMLRIIIQQDVSSYYINLLAT